MSYEAVSDHLRFDRLLRRHYASVHRWCELRESEPSASRARAWAILSELYRLVSAPRVLH